ncbi:hypothetical protein [Arthrobacter sp. NPDC093139]|uniref:hypothetical protein n=1 Tax=Arthrobacter sp. NPDC093139 TaxID=3363945 RepID=UPI0037F87EC3
MLEGEFGLFVEETAGHDEVAGHPFGALGFERFDLVLRSAVQFLAGDVLINLGGTLAVRAVRAAQVPYVGDADRTVLCPVTAELARTGVAPVKAARRPLLPVTKRFAVLAAAEAASVSLAVTTRTITKRLTLPATKATAITLALTTRTITKRLTLPATKATTITLALTTRTITKGLTLPATKATTIALALTTRTITKRLTLPAGATARVVSAASFPGPESSRITAGVVGPPEWTAPCTVAARIVAVMPAAIAAVVLSHGGFLL